MQTQLSAIISISSNEISTSEIGDGQGRSTFAIGSTSLLNPRCSASRPDHL
jgi:hypothetical protein